jgi:general secretion pathway protein N
MSSVLRVFRGFPLLGLLAFVVFLLATTPLPFVWSYLRPQLGPLPVDVRAVSGTLWNARLQLADPLAGVLGLDWKLSPLSLLTISPELAINLRAEQMSASLDIQLLPNGSLLVKNGKGYLEAAMLTPILRKNRAEFAGSLEISNLQLQLQLQQPLVFSKAEGRVVYSGGSASFPVDRKIVNSDIPMLVGDMGMDDKGGLLMPVTTADRAAVSQLFVKQDGWGGIRIQRRLLDLIGLPWKGKEAPDSIVFEVSQKIL